MNEPFQGQKFTSSYGIYSPDENGASELTTLWSSAGRGIMNRSKRVYMLPDGSFTDACIEPLKAYYFLVDRYVYDIRGKISIEGRFPNFKTSDGKIVWLDHDGSFLMVPIDFVSRYILRRKHMASKARTSRIVSDVRKSKSGLRIAVRDDGTLWHWTVYLLGDIVSEGDEYSREMAKEVAKRHMRAYVEDVTLTKKTKGFRPSTKGFLTYMKEGNHWMVVRQVFKRGHALSTPADFECFDSMDAAKKHYVEWKRAENWMKDKQRKLTCSAPGVYVIEGVSETFSTLTTAVDFLRDETFSTKA